MTSQNNNTPMLRSQSLRSQSLRSQWHPSKYQGGFTIIELMVSLGFLGILLALAAPSLNAFMQRQSINSQAERINSALSLARAEALNLADDITVCWNPGTAAIIRKGYSIAAGNLAVLVGDQTEIIDVNTDVLADFNYSNGLFIADDETDNCIVINDQGRLDISQVTGNSLLFGVCSRSGVAEDSRLITLTATGRSVSKNNVDSSGVATINCS